MSGKPIIGPECSWRCSNCGKNKWDGVCPDHWVKDPSVEQCVGCGRLFQPYEGHVVCKKCAGDSE